VSVRFAKTAQALRGCTEIRASVFQYLLKTLSRKEMAGQAGHHQAQSRAQTA
jgi:hypothetical protein